jgi:hypothetical protein
MSGKTRWIGSVAITATAHFKASLAMRASFIAFHTAVSDKILDKVIVFEANAVDEPLAEPQLRIVLTCMFYIHPWIWRKHFSFS